MTLQPVIRPGEPPDLHRIGEYVFQDLCCELLHEEDDVSSCSIFGTRGYAQEGIDILGYRRNNDGIVVGQCKCSKNFPPSKITEASKEFLDHWARWSSEGVKRFILFVACDLKKPDQQNQILIERKKFQAIGVEYEVWPLATIVIKLRPHRGIVKAYLTADYWVEYICGREVPPMPIEADARQSLISAVASTESIIDVSGVSAQAAASVERELERARESWREGSRAEATKWIADLKANSAFWPILPVVVKANVLRFEAGIELDMNGDTGIAKTLIDEADALSPTQDSVRVRAMIALKEHGLERALAILGDSTTADSVNLQAALLIAHGESRRALELLETIGAAETENG